MQAILSKLCVTGLLLGMTQAQAASESSCNRQCLDDILTRYEQSVIKHDAKAQPFAANLRMTENYRPIQPGAGYWQNIGKIHYRNVFADAVSGQVAAVGFLDHGGRDAYYALRLKVVNRQITQSEMLLIHKGDAQFFEADVAKRIDKPYTEAVPAKQRSTREQLIKLADGFTDAWQYRNEDYAAFAADCRFYENNVELTNNPQAPADPTCGGMLEFGGKNGVAGTGKFTNPNSSTDQSRQGQGQNQGQNQGMGAPSGNGGDAMGAAPQGNGRGNGQGNGPGRVATQRAADPSINLPALFGSQMWMRDRRYPIVDVEKGVVFFYHIQGGTPAKSGEPVVYERATSFGSNPNPQAGGGGAAYMAALMKVVDGKIVRVDHFEWEGGPNASGGFAD
ncbi:MAG: hypothetical protein QM808_14420 [Steroidobacteraceae bacterium]